MPRGTPGLRTVRSDWGNDSIYRRRKKTVPRPLTEEERAESRKRSEEAMRMVGRLGGVAEEDLDLFVNNPDAYRTLCQQRKSQQRVLAKLIDGEARQSVEGNTDLNHDNLEVPADASRD